MTSDNLDSVRVRFAPSPTGYLHIGGARTVLFNWLLARKAGGTFVLRIEDTDRTRHVEDSVQKILDDLRWLGLDWDEGPEAGGDYGPYFQSQRLDLYNEHLQRLLESGQAYYALETPEQLQAMRETAIREKRALNYQRPDPLPTIEQGQAARAQGRQVVVRFKMPPTDITVVDDILGEVTVAAGQIEDFVIQKGDGFPTYHFACVVDDALMKITHVLRGQEHLMNTPKHVALQRALGLSGPRYAHLPTVFKNTPKHAVLQQALRFPAPRYAHLPVIFNMDGSKMSKRDKEKAIAQGQPPPEIDVHDFRTAGYLPEALLNFISLLGWSPGEDREQFTLAEAVSLFSIDRVGKTNAKFDRDKLLSFNKDWAARLPAARLFAAFKDYLAVTGSPMGKSDDATLRHLLGLCAGFRTFPDAENKTRFLYTADEEIEYEPKAIEKVLAKSNGAGYAMLEYLLPKFEALTDWNTGTLEALLQSAVEDKQTKLGNVAQPVRVAITGSTISPSIHESLALLGKEKTLNRIRNCLSRAGGPRP